MLAAILLLTGCGSARPWTRVTSPHYELRAELPPGEALELAFRLERTRAAALRTLFAGWPEPEGRTRVLAVKPPRERGFTRLDAFGERLMVVDPSDPGSARHEVAHGLVAQLFGELPRWLNEGLAVTLEAPQRAPSRPPDLARMQAWRWGDPEDATVYVDAWRVVRWLLDEGKLARVLRGEKLALPVSGADPVRPPLEDPVSCAAAATSEEPPGPDARGWLLFAEGLPDELREPALRHAAELAPLDEVPQLRLAWWLAQHGRREEAARIAARAHRLAPSNPLAVLLGSPR